jgi:fructosamine-3-kinase
MVEGEFESLKAMHAVSPGFVPEPYGWGHYSQDGKEYYFLLEQFRLVGEQPPDPVRFTEKLADFHKRSISPNGKFGFHTTTCHAQVPQLTDQWSESWSEVYQKHLGYMVKQDQEQNGLWPEFKVLCNITLEHVIPRLLEPLQSDGRSIKPCLVHGDLWDENTATDMSTGEPFIFDPASLWAHNEYETGNWRAIRHRLSNKSYIDRYKDHFPASEPGKPASPALFPSLASFHSKERIKLTNHGITISGRVGVAKHSILTQIQFRSRHPLPWFCSATSVRSPPGAKLIPAIVNSVVVLNMEPFFLFFSLFNDMKTLCEQYFPDLLRSRLAEL